MRLAGFLALALLAAASASAAGVREGEGGRALTPPVKQTTTIKITTEWKGKENCEKECEHGHHAPHLHHSHHVGWTYLHGGSDWEGVCKTGTHQSPINLDKEAGLKVDAESAHGSLYALQTKYAPAANVSLQNSGRLLHMDGDFGYVVSGAHGVQYDAVSVNFHSPSEHTVDGNRFPMEAHIVHRRRGETGLEGLLVVAVLFDEGPSSSFLNELHWATVPQVNNTVHIKQPVDLTGLGDQVMDHQYFAYEGSMTTPDCVEGVQWRVMETVATMSRSQISAIKNLFAESDAFAEGRGNYRDLQELNGRHVLRVMPAGMSWAGGEHKKHADKAKHDDMTPFIEQVLKRIAEIQNADVAKGHIMSPHEKLDAYAELLIRVEHEVVLISRFRDMTDSVRGKASEGLEAALAVVDEVHDDITSLKAEGDDLKDRADVHRRRTRLAESVAPEVLNSVARQDQAYRQYKARVRVAEQALTDTYTRLIDTADALRAKYAKQLKDDPKQKQMEEQHAKEEAKKPAPPKSASGAALQDLEDRLGKLLKSEHSLRHRAHNAVDKAKKFRSKLALYNEKLAQTKEDERRYDQMYDDANKLYMHALTDLSHERQRIASGHEGQLPAQSLRQAMQAAHPHQEEGEEHESEHGEKKKESREEEEEGHGHGEEDAAQKEQEHEDESEEQHAETEHDAEQGHAPAHGESSDAHEAAHEQVHGEDEETDHGGEAPEAHQEETHVGGQHSADEDEPHEQAHGDARFRALRVPDMTLM